LLNCNLAKGKSKKKAETFCRERHESAIQLFNSSGIDIFGVPVPSTTVRGGSVKGKREICDEVKFS